jgi:hypothetical protein
MQPEDQTTIDALHALIVESSHAGGEAAEFWRAFDALAGDLGARAFADDADGDLREAWCEVLANADDAGFAVP